jgi:hypothetical protein
MQLCLDLFKGVVLGVMLLAFVTITVGCGEDDNAATQNGQEQIMERAQPLEDWGSVRAVDSRSSTDILLRLLRRVDGWHMGEAREVILRYQSDGLAADEFGNQVQVSAEEWKGTTNLIRNSPSQPLQFRAGPASMYQDGLGEIPRHTYEIVVLSEEEIRFVLIE